MGRFSSVVLGRHFGVRNSVSFQASLGGASQVVACVAVADFLDMSVLAKLRNRRHACNL